MSVTAHYVGNNREFTVNDISDVTLHFNQIGSDTDTVKYAHASDESKRAAARKFTLRANQTVQILGMDGITFTDPTTIIINTAWTERFSDKFGKAISSMAIRTTVTGTTVRIRWHGGY